MDEERIPGRWWRAAWIIAGVIGVSPVVVAGAGCGGSGEAGDTVVVTEMVAAADAGATTAGGEGPGDAAPAPQVLSGSGQRVKSIDIARDTPLVVTGTHSGSSNFIVDIAGGDYDDNLFNEIGAFTGTTVVTGVTTGRRRVKVNADGPWKLTFTQPNPPANATPIPGSITGTGSGVVWIHAGEDSSPIITGRHRGDSNFIVDIISADGSAEENLFNEIGAHSGETTTGIPGGDYLLSVTADGDWSLRFTP